MIKRYANIHAKEGELRRIKIRVPQTTAAITFIKSFADKKYNAKQKLWNVPLTLRNAEALKNRGYKIARPLEAYIQLRLQKKRENTIPMPVFKEGLELMPFQADGVRLIEQMNGRALLADEMGLGKTIQAIAWLMLHPERLPVVIIVPATIKIKWMRECMKWMYAPNVQILEGRKPYKITGDIIIINPDILRHWTRVLTKIGTKVVIADEAHRFKSGTAKRSTALKRLTNGVPHVIGMSGTPIQNRPAEIYHVANVINPEALPPKLIFENKFCDRKHNGFGWEAKGATNIPELFQLLTDTIMIRRLKRDVAKDLPPKQYAFVPFHITNRAEYERASKDFLNYMKDRIETNLEELNENAAKAFKTLSKSIKGIDLSEIKTKNLLTEEEIAEIVDDKLGSIASAKTLVQISILRRLAMEGKLDAAVEWIRDFLESGEKLVVFVTHKFVTARLMEAFPNALKIDGSVTGPRRQKAQDEFQDNPKQKLLIGNHQAAGEGIDLYAAFNVAILEFPWTPAAVDQDVDRCHRIGQTADKVNIWYLVAVDTIEEKLATIIDEKRKIVQNTLNGTYVGMEPLVKELINHYKKQKV